eukprot:CAMPEP_0198224316 /NCGR_PEP_ID=MMETSP1445-20131203/96397_1 /TAXON_ID=36898 /ORGANISM="Pyramimonas sp., Strain CCMP2087" /LENGTH=88 /DNA_ID=CAMNT_0043903443 /DNA_START=15 /DNA_END=278 /DNA_ORIENTATION=+
MRDSADGGVASFRELRTLARHQGFVRCCTFSPSGHVLISGSADRQWVIQLDVQSLEALTHCSKQEQQDGDEAEGSADVFTPRAFALGL